MKCFLAVLVTVFLFQISVSDARATDDHQDDSTLIKQDAPPEGQKVIDAAASTTDRVQPKEPASPTLDKVPSGRYYTEDELRVLAATQPPKSPSLIGGMVHNGVQKLQRTVSNGWNWLSGVTGSLLKTGQDAGRYMVLGRSPSDVAEKAYPQPQE